MNECFIAVAYEPASSAARRLRVHNLARGRFMNFVSSCRCQSAQRRVV